MGYSRCDPALNIGNTPPPPVAPYTWLSSASWKTQIKYDINTDNGRMPCFWFLTNNLATQCRRITPVHLPIEVPMNPSQHGFQVGFTLTELAISLVIIALLVGGLTIPLTAQMELRDLNETRKQLDDAREALLGYAVTNGVLPCPASIASNGVAVAGAVAGTCGSTDGLLPWADLGLARTDSWSHQLRYRVLPAFADSTTPFTLGTAVSPNLPDLAGRSCSANPLTSANKVAAVILSHGRNGYFGTTDARSHHRQYIRGQRR